MKEFQWLLTLKNMTDKLTRSWTCCCCWWTCSRSCGNWPKSFDRSGFNHEVSKGSIFRSISQNKNCIIYMYHVIKNYGKKYHNTPISVKDKREQLVIITTNWNVFKVNFVTPNGLQTSLNWNQIFQNRNTKMVNFVIE